MYGVIALMSMDHDTQGSAKQIMLMEVVQPF